MRQFVIPCMVLPEARPYMVPPSRFHAVTKYSESRLKKSLVDEVDKAFSAGLKTARDVRRMELLTAVYNETLRFHPVSQGMPFYAEKDFIYEGKKVCAGDITVLSQVPMSFSRRIFLIRSVSITPECCVHETNIAADMPSILTVLRIVPARLGGLVELMAVTMVATILHDNQVEMMPAGYNLGLAVRPLPAPNNRVRIKTVLRSAAGKDKTALLSEENVDRDFPRI